MHSIPVEVLFSIEAHRPDLAPLIHDLMATTDSPMARMLEKRLAAAYLDGVSRLGAEETMLLSACRAGKKYGDIDPGQLH